MGLIAGAGADEAASIEDDPAKIETQRQLGVALLALDFGFVVIAFEIEIAEFAKFGRLESGIGGSADDGQGIFEVDENLLLLREMEGFEELEIGAVLERLGDEGLLIGMSGSVGGKISNQAAVFRKIFSKEIVEGKAGFGDIQFGGVLPLGVEIVGDFHAENGAFLDFASFKKLLGGGNCVGLAAIIGADEVVAFTGAEGIGERLTDLEDDIVERLAVIDHGLVPGEAA